MAVQQGRSKRRGESYSVPYVEPLSDARTPLADFFSILLVEQASVFDCLLSCHAATPLDSRFRGNDEALRVRSALLDEPDEVAILGI